MHKLGNNFHTTFAWCGHVPTAKKTGKFHIS